MIDAGLSEVAASAEMPGQNANGSAPPELREGATIAPEACPGSKLIKAATRRHSTLAELLGARPEQLSDADFVHDLRVAARRLGEVARLLGAGGGFMDKPTARAVDASLKTLRQSMGELRDADVTREHLMKWRMPAPVKNVAREVAEELEHKREKLEKAARVQMEAASVSGAMVVLARVLEQQSAASAVEQTERKLAGAVAGLLKKREKQMRRAFGKAARK
jgi:CHAD domain-containing protein